MPRICYTPKTFSEATLAVVVQANRIIAEYAAQGFDLTLRQLYYQFVSRDLIRNTQQEYKRLGNIINEARLAGLIDWNHITDRTRNLRSNSHWDTPAEIIGACASQFRVDLWEGQGMRLEVWIEKDALVGVIEGVCRRLDIPFFSCRGYTSQSEMWAAGRRLEGYIRDGQTPIVLHLGDHDPSGIDMSRDIEDRLRLFITTDLIDVENADLDLRRIALNQDQIDHYNPPPNPAKTTDSRSGSYIALHGNESWELDALDPNVITALIEREASRFIDQDVWQERQDEQAESRRQLGKLSQHWTKVTDYLHNLNGGI